MQETKKFYSSLSLLLLLNVIVKPLWIFAIDRQVQNEVGLVEYGTLFSVWNLSIVLIFLLDCGLTVFYNQQLSVKNTSTSAQAGNFIVIKLALAILYAVVIFLVAWFTGIDRWHIILYVILVQVLTSMFVFFRGIITSQQWFKTDAWLSVLDKMLMILLCGLLLFYPSSFGGMSIERFLLLQIACLIIALVTAWTILISRKFHFPIQKIWPGKNVLRSALPFGIIVLLMSFHARIDGFLLERMSGAEEAGKYAAAYRLLDAANMLGVLFATFFLPYIARQHSEGKNISDVTLTIRHLLISSAIALSCVVIFLAPWIHDMLYEHQSDDAANILRWCIPALIGYSMVQVYGTLLTATGHIAAFIYINLMAVALNLLLNVLLIPSMEAKGSCIAALVSQGFCGIVTMWYVKQRLRVAIHIRSLLIYFFIAALLCGFLYLSRNAAISNWMIMAGAGTITLLVLWATRLINLKSWKISLRN